MIKLTKYELENQIQLLPEYIFTFQIENPAKLYNLTMELRSQNNGEEGGFYLLKNDKVISIENNLEFIGDFLNFEANNKKFSNLLLKKFNLFLGQEGENIEKLNNIERETASIIERFQIYSNIDIDYVLPADYDFLIKGFNLKIKEENKTLVEKLITYINCAKELKKLEVICLMFAKEFLTKDDILKLHKHCEYLNICLLLIESANNMELLENEKKLIIDKDLCEIVC